MQKVSKEAAGYEIGGAISDLLRCVAELNTAIAKTKSFGVTVGLGFQTAPPPSKEFSRTIINDQVAVQIELESSR